MANLENKKFADVIIPDNYKRFFDERIEVMEGIGNNQNIFVILEEYFNEKNIKWYETSLVSNMEKREKGAIIQEKDCIRALIYAQLSNQTKWSRIEANLEKIDKLFFDYNKSKIISTPWMHFYNGIRSLKCGNISIKKQMEGLTGNLEILESLANQHGSYEAFFISKPAPELVKMFTNGKYKLNQIGIALAWELLRHLGIDGAKPDVHMKRILGSERLGFSEKNCASENEVLWVATLLSKRYNIYQVEIDALLWTLCADNQAEICMASAKCDICPIRQQCKTK